MKVLVACEFSGIVREAFNACHGVRAISCDLLPPEDGRVDFHYQGDVREILWDGWDLMIAHPECTYLCSSGLHWNTRRPERAALTERALEFVATLLNAPHRPHRPGEPRRPHQQSNPQTRSDHPAVAVRPPGIQIHLFMAKKPARPSTHRRSGPARVRQVAKPDAQRPKQARTQPKPVAGPGADLSRNRAGDGLPVGSVRIVFADECLRCPCFGEPWCEECNEHYADCSCLGPSNAEDEGYTVVHVGGKTYGIPKKS